MDYLPLGNTLHRWRVSSRDESSNWSARCIAGAWGRLPRGYCDPDAWSASAGGHLFNESTLSSPASSSLRPCRPASDDILTRSSSIGGSRRASLEVDEVQHFNEFRLATLKAYPANARLAFPKEIWMGACLNERGLKGVGFGKPCPPLFPGEGGRHRQRAFRDALADILPLVHGWAPTLRIAHFEVESWVYNRNASARIADFIAGRW